MGGREGVSEREKENIKPKSIKIVCICRLTAFFLITLLIPGTFSEILNDTVSFLQNVGPQNLENLVPSVCSVTPGTSTISCRPGNAASAVAPSSSGSPEKVVRKRSKKSTITRGTQKLSSRRRESSGQTSQGVSTKPNFPNTCLIFIS